MSKLRGAFLQWGPGQFAQAPSTEQTAACVSAGGAAIYIFFLQVGLLTDTFVYLFVLLMSL